MQLLAGVGDEEISDNVVSTVRSRTTWLVVNLVTAVLASLVIGLFDATIEQMVALAVLMPIVASMGGNAGTQTMTVTVRALAMRELDGPQDPPARRPRDAGRPGQRDRLRGADRAAHRRVVLQPSLGLVIGLAMMVNMVAAGRRESSFR